MSVLAEIDLDALRHNAMLVRQIASGSRIMAVVKSMAYGHGAVPVARALESVVDAFAVARVSEGVELRAANVRLPIVVLEGPGSAEELALCADFALQATLHHPSQLALLRENSAVPAMDYWLKFDTGMHRLGFPAAYAAERVAQVLGMSQVASLACMTHLACADDPGDAMTRRQWQRFADGLADTPVQKSVANSAGILAWPETHADWVRPGLMLYGASPLISRGARELGLQPVMTLSAPLLAINDVPAGESVGYGATWRAPEAMRLGVVGVGYGDGYPRQIGEEGKVLLQGKLLPVVGRVSMDMLTVDLRGVHASVGDRVTLWGQGLPVDEVAGWAGTIPYTLLCGVTARVERRYRITDGQSR